MEPKIWKYRRDLIIGKIIVYMSAALMIVGAVYGVVINHDYSFLGAVAVMGLVVVLGRVLGKGQKDYIKLMTRLPSDHKLITTHMTVVDIGNFRFTYNIYEKGNSFRPSNKTYLSLSVPIPFPENDFEAGIAITEDLEALISRLRSEGVLTDSAAMVREDDNDEIQWTGQPLFMEFLLKGVTSDWLIALQNDIVAILNHHKLQELMSCRILGTAQGTVFSLYKGNLFCSYVFKDAFDSSLSRRSYKSTYELTRTGQEASYDISEYNRLYESANDLEGGLPFDDLENVIKMMFNGLGVKTVVKISYEENGIRTSITIPSKTAASKYYLTHQSGYWWIHAHGRLENIIPMSIEDEYTACEMYLEVLNDTRHRFGLI